jgi:hypothetical protein
MKNTAKNSIKNNIKNEVKQPTPRPLLPGQAARLEAKADEMSCVLITVYAALDCLGCTFEDLAVCHQAVCRSLEKWEAQTRTQ